jgi:hypothetical protein
LRGTASAIPTRPSINTTLEQVFTYPIDGESYRSFATRSDRPWGHGLKVVRLGQAGAVIDVVFFFCHPEFTDFEEFHQMSTADLLRIAEKMPVSRKMENALLTARQAGLQLGRTRDRECVSKISGPPPRTGWLFDRQCACSRSRNKPPHQTAPPNPTRGATSYPAPLTHSGPRATGWYPTQEDPLVERLHPRRITARGLGFR